MSVTNGFLPIFAQTLKNKPESIYANNPLQVKLNRMLTSQIRCFLKQNLPDYMVPSAFVVLERLPLTPNGKLDRRALPVPHQFMVDLEKTFKPPRTPSERVVAGIWAEVLGIEQVGKHDNFFQLGGHSLLATQIISRLREAFRVEIPLRSIFQEPTVVGLIKVIAVMWGSRETVEEIAKTLQELEELSEQDLEALLRT
jgi:acyl carrier protein